MNGAVSVAQGSMWVKEIIRPKKLKKIMHYNIMLPLPTWTDGNQPITINVASKQIEQQYQRNKCGHLNFTNLNGWHKKVNDTQVRQTTSTNNTVEARHWHGENAIWWQAVITRNKWKNLVLNWKKNKNPKMNGWKRPRKTREKREREGQSIQQNIPRKTSVGKLYTTQTQLLFKFDLPF
jgi:hypothetical protein